MKRKQQTYYLLCIAIISCLFACRKDELLDKKPSTDIVVPSTLEDFLALLDNDPIMNETPVLGDVSADNYYLLSSFWTGLNVKERNAYVWSQDIYQGQINIPDWNIPYQQVFYANVVLDGLSKITVTPTNEQLFGMVKGGAHFARGLAFYHLAQLFAPAYDNASATSDPGIPLRLTPGIDEVSVRASVQQTYDQIIADVKEACRLLPASVATNNRNRPCKPAAFLLMARTYLSMRMYDKAGLYADSSLQLYNELMDYNSLSTTSPFPISRANTEIMYQARLYSGTAVMKAVTATSCIIDSTLYKSYAPDDLRKVIFYGSNISGLPIAKGSYTGSTYDFSGLATDEAYVTRAECLARAGNTTAALNDLNTLLRKRWKSGVPFVPLTASTSAEAITVALSERRKELPFRGIRWADIRRLNKEGANIILARFVNSQPYTLPPGDKRYVLPIPPDVIALSGIPQNPR